MGCATSKQDINDINPHMFHVFNVDDQGNSVNAGKLEIEFANMDLILHQKGKEPIRWPVRCLRRYGFEQDLFSFESGRRCPTGPGIYAFRCRRAETLFNMLQECIQMAGAESDHHSNSTHSVNGGQTASRPSSFTDQLTPNSGGYGVILQNNFPFGPSNSQSRREHLYVNGQVASEYLPPIQTMSGNNTVLRETTHDYMNTGLAASFIPNNRNGLQSADSTKIQITFDKNDNPSASLINYAVLDLPKSTENLTEIDKNDSVRSNGHIGNGNPPKIKYVDLDKEALMAIQSQGKDALSNGVNNLANIPRNENLVQDSRLSVTNVQQPTYINIGAEAKKAEFPREAKRPAKIVIPKDQHSYANLDLMPSVGVGNRLDPPGMRRVNYIQLDLEKNDEKTNGIGAVPPSPLSLLSVPDSPSRRTESYATIDFNKTVALSNSAKPSATPDEGQRKTRHNSTINEL